MAWRLRQQRGVMHAPVPLIASGIAIAVLAVPPAARAQTVQYAYDAAGRLSVVADPTGDLAIYRYDPVGNLLSIERIGVRDVPDAVVIAHIAPDVGARGATVSIFGRGFGGSADANAVTFNDVPATVHGASPTRLTVRVPATATTGPIRVTTPLGAATSKPFRVLGAFVVSPPTALVAPRGTVRFVALGDGALGVRWSVDRVAGGDAQRGTITTEGVYVAPETLTSGGVNVTATSLVDPTLEATARVTMVAPRPLFVSAESVALGFPASLPRIELTAASSVAVATNTAFAIAAPLTLYLAPVVLGVTPSTVARGENIRLAVIGAGMDGATRLEFWTAAGPDPALAVTDLLVNGDGTEATADVTVSADAALGPRIVRVVTPAGSSGGAVTDENVLIVR